MHDIVCRATTYELSTLDYTGVVSVCPVSEDLAVTWWGPPA